MSDLINTVILAAGKGTRLKIERPKPLCPANGRVLLDYVLDEIKLFNDNSSVNLGINFVVGHKKEEVIEHLKGEDVTFTTQAEQLGTGHALKCFFDQNEKAWDSKYTIVTCADTPLISANVYSKLLEKIKLTNSKAICASFIAHNPFGYGRIEHDKDGFNIVEEKDASEEQKKIQEVNSGLYIFETEHIKETINSLNTNNKNNEFYLTDLFKAEYDVKTIIFEDAKQFTGVNNMEQLEIVERAINEKIILKHKHNGVRFLNSSSCLIEGSVEIEGGVTIYPNVCLFGETKISKGVIIEPGTIIRDSSVASNTVVKAYSYFEKANIGTDAAIGPFARLREGSDIGNSCKIGNFVETKKSKLHVGSKVSHLSYVGDAEIGERTNIGCGFITCNYDGANKHKTSIGKDSFIGSDCQMIAPINIGDEAYIGSGSTINQNVPDGAFAIARQRQVTKENMAKKFIKKK